MAGVSSNTLGPSVVIGGRPMAGATSDYAGVRVAVSYGIATQVHSVIYNHGAHVRLDLQFVARVWLPH